MTITKAIEIVEHWQKGGDITSFDDVNKAVKLGIEALQFLERWRAKAEIQPFPILPSETVD